MASNRKPVLQSVDVVLTSLVHLEDSLADVKPDSSSEALGKHVNQFVKSLSDLKSRSHLLEDDVPLDLVEFLDRGGNPDVFTRDLFLGCVQANQESKGKVSAFRSLRDKLGEALEEEYPQEWKAFQNITSCPNAT